MRGPSPYKGHPKSEWPKIKAELDAKRAEAGHAAPPPDVREPAPAMESERGVIPPNLFSGDQKQLEVLGLDGTPQDPIPGFKLYWFNDVDIRISKAQRSGYVFVERDEVLLSEGLVSGDDVAGNHVRKLVESKGEKPVYAYLMKKPMWIVEAHDLEYSKVNDRVEDMVRRGQLSKNPQEVRQYVNDGRAPSNLPQNLTETKSYTSR
jgi:hypothetical protein